MNEYVFGANILESLTTGMYQDSKVIYREYIQNACDQIDKAIRDGLLLKSEGYIHIWLDPDRRNISIEDNATGIPAAEFKKTLGNIADSDKIIGEDKGFRGIGRLCGLAYCKELVFTSTTKGETIVSTMRCNAKKMRELIDANARGEKYTASDILHSINEFTTENMAKPNDHWFKVELIGINDENTDLLDFTQIKEYLSFVAPVPYINTFIFRSEIHKHAKEINYHIDEYAITLNGEAVVKKYKTNFKTHAKGDDEIFDIEYKDVRDLDGNLLAWIWWGVSRFKAAIQKDCQMRGLRLRKENIQIGDDDALQKLFKEDRGHHYFIGEVFAVAKDLIPNSQRDYFNENETRNQFELELKRYFNDELKSIYYGGSAINSAFDKIDIFVKKEAEFKEKESNGEFVDTIHREEELAEIEKAKSKAMEAKIEIERKKQKAEEKNNTVMGRLIERIEKERTQSPPITTIVKPPNPDTKKDTKIPWRTDKLSTYSKKERKLISKIFGIIVASTNKETAESIIKRIEDELQ
ncbi:MAG: ATP-binding protein [Prolixibacteraceae bacterium]|nr:ATP-binding protein [Prolixibacteraceae bacterium]